VRVVRPQPDRRSHSQSPKREAMKSRVYSRVTNYGGTRVYDNKGSVSSSSSSSVPIHKKEKGKKKRKGRKRYNDFDEMEEDNGCCGLTAKACESTCRDKTQGPLAILGGLLLIVVLLL